MTCRPTTIAQKYSDGIMRDGASFDGFESLERLITAQNNPVRLYNDKQLVDTAQTLNQALKKSNLSDFPYLDSRVQQAPILFTEVADFLNQAGYDLNTVERDLNDYMNQSIIFPVATPNDVPSSLFTEPFRNICKQMELYYSENMANTISGGFCSAFGNPFGKLQEALALLSVGKGLLDQLLSFDISHLIKMFSLKAMVDQLKDKLVSIVDNLKSTLEQQITNVVNQVKNFAQNVVNKVMRAVNNVKAFLNDFSMEKLKERIGKFVDNTQNQFEELTSEAIGLMLFRFCQFAELIQGFMKGPLDALKNFATGYAASEAVLNNVSQRQTARATSYGAVRLSDPVIKRTRERLRDAASPTKEDDARGPAGPRPEPSSYVPTTELTPEENELLANMSDDGVPGYFTFNIGVTGLHTRFGNRVRDAAPGDGWRRVDQDVWVRLMIVARRLGVTLNINSAYRSPDYNRIIGGAKESLHMSGKAIDVNMNPLSDEQIRNFIRVASQEGFLAIQYYSKQNFMHVDTSSKRTWRSGGRFQEWIDMHMSGGFTQGKHEEPTARPDDGSSDDPNDPEVPLEPGETLISIRRDDDGNIISKTVQRQGVDAEGFSYTETIRIPIEPPISS